MHELFLMLQCNSIGNLLIYVLREIGYCCTSMKTRTAAHSWFVPHTTDSLFVVFPSDIWCKINKLLKYYKYQLTKRCLAGRLDGFKVSSWFLKTMRLVEDRIAKKCHDFHHCCRWLHHHYSRGCHVRFHFNETLFNSDDLILKEV